MRIFKPTLHATRGNTASGKTRAISWYVPELAQAMQATKDLPHRAVNPDNFKADLLKLSPGMTSDQVHAEACMLADRLENELLGMKTADGRPASMVIDKRLPEVHDVRGYADKAKESGREFALYDVDAPLEHCLVGVLERAPGGSDQLPPFRVVEKGFDAARVNREEVMNLFSDPSMGSYRLYGTTASGDLVEAMSIVGGIVEMKNEELAMQATTHSTESLARTQIATEIIDEHVQHLQPERAAKIRTILNMYEGWTWKSALDAHSREIVE